MKIIQILKEIKRKIIMPSHGYYAFLKTIKANGSLLDVGCGNDSPFRVKSLRPDIFYTGIDIGDYNLTKPNLADKYIITTPEQFSETIATMQNYFDAVISSHNLEHCNDRDKTLDAMIKSIRGGGYLYLSFPTANSVNFPNRKGTLNYYDDPTHLDKPPDFHKIIEVLKHNDFDIFFAAESYKPFLYRIKGFFDEPLSRKKNQVYYSTWAYYGFESIIWAKKR
ncbi:hypothetical protein FACS1894137_14830 [Spirochaetia bacterium]|nr:hypothetical protein FACS1894137_14830 [Spirochaetia bacterium]